MLSEIDSSIAKLQSEIEKLQDQRKIVERNLENLVLTLSMKV